MVVAPETSDRRALPVVFLGPSLSHSEASTLLHADYRPPIRRGDLLTVEPGRRVVIIDGEFDQTFSVSLKEILRFLDAEGVVIGASSMGALRAAELVTEGMIGLGEIYEAYRTGQIEGDDEVALRFCPLSLQSITIPLVNIRFWLDRLLAEGWLNPVECSMLLRRARRIFYTERTGARVDALLEATLGASRSAALRASGLGKIRDVKSDDARAALSAVALMDETSS
jgi:hypothetical protein